MKNFKRGLILLVAVAMIFSMIPSTSFAWADTENPTGTGDESSSVFDVSGENETEDPITNEMAAEEEATADPVQTEPANGDRTYSDGNITLSASFVEGATDTNGNMVKKVQNYSAGQAFKYGIYLNLDESVYTPYEAGAVKIYIPYSILKHMDMVDETGVYDPSLPRILDDDPNSCYLNGSGAVPESAATEDTDWYYKETTRDGKHCYVFINNKPLVEFDSLTFHFEVQYRTVFETYAYADYNPSSLSSCDSEPFDVILEATDNSGNTTIAQDSAEKVYIDTDVTLTSVKKERITSWPRSLPVDGVEKNFLFIQYKVTAKIHGNTPSSDPTQQFNLLFDDGFEGAFSNMRADYDKDGENDATFELVGYCATDSANENDYSLNANYFTGCTTHSLSSDEYVVYVLVKLEYPDSLYKDCNLDNKVIVTLQPTGKPCDPITGEGNANWSVYYENTRPWGRFMIHKWGNNNYDSSEHSRTDAYDVTTNYKRGWGHSNNELNFFENGDIDELQGFRFFVWYEGYSVRYTPYTSPHELTYVFEDQDIGIHKTGSTSSAIGDGNIPQQTAKVNGVNITKTALDPEDYYYSEVDFYPEAQNATYDSVNKQWVTIKETKPDGTVNNPFDGDEPILVQAKFNSKDSDWVDVAKVTYSKTYAQTKKQATGTIKWSDTNLVDASFGNYEGEEYGYQDKGFRIKFKNKNCVGYRIVHTNDHYYWMCNVKPTVNLKNSAWVLSLLGTQSWMYVVNVADMTVFDDTSDNENHQIFNFAKDAKTEEYNHLPNRIAADAAVFQNNLLSVNKHISEEVQIDSDNIYKATWMINGRGYKYAGINPVGITYNSKSEILDSGIFFDVLPRGAQIDTDSIKVYKVCMDKELYFKTKNGSFDRYLIPADQYEVDVIDNNTYNGHSLNGLTMVKISINTQGNGVTSSTSFYIQDDDKYHSIYPGYTVLFDTLSYYEDLDRFGKILVNATAFEAGNGTTYHEWGYPDTPKVKDGHNNSSLLTKISSTHPDKQNIIDALTDLKPDENNNVGDEYWFGYDFASTEVMYNEHSTSGLSKRVKLPDESTWGIKREVAPGGQYQYRIRYATDIQTTVSNLILYDNIEKYVYPTGASSEWFGTVNSMEIVPPSNTTATVPVKYYISTVDNTVVNNSIDLSDGNWTEVAAGADLSTIENIKWVAADTTGFTLGKASEMCLIVNMTAPSTNTTNKIKPVTYNDSHAKGFQPVGENAKAGDDFVNVSNPTEVSYTLNGEVWVEKLDEAGRPMRNVTFTLKGTSSLLDEEGNPAEVDMTATTDQDGHAIFEDVPLSGESSYTLAEKAPIGYLDEGKTWTVKILADGSTEIDGEDKTGVYLVVVNRASTRINVRKVWQNADDTNTPPDGAEVTFTLFADGEATDIKVVLDGEAETYAEGAINCGVEARPWFALFLGLPKYKMVNGNPVEIEYTVQETGTWPGYTVSYGDGTTATYAVNGSNIINTEVPTELSVTKAWKNADGSTTPPEDAEVTFTLYADGVATPYTVTLDGETDTAVAQGGYESAAWKATFAGLPKTKVVNGETVDIVYTVQETGTWPGYTVKYGDGTTATYAVDGGTITNTQESTGLTVTKIWQNADGTTTAPEDAVVTFTLYADGEATNYAVTLDGEADTAVAQGGYESAAWKATFTGLPKTKVVNGETVDIVYTVQETGTWPGYVVSYPNATVAYAVDGESITNTQEPTELSVIKAWKNADGSTTPPDGAEVTFTLFADGTDTGYSVTLDGTADTAITGAGGYESEAWKATFVNLPKYKIVNGRTVEIQYTVTETGTWPGYVVTYGSGMSDFVPTYAVDGQTITNTEESTYITVIKAWENADGTTTAPEGATVTFTLYADGSRTEYTAVLDGTADTTVPEGTAGFEPEAWTAAFIRLPKYKIVNDAAVEIEYTVVETGTWAGYIVIYEGEDAVSAIANGVITNKEVPTGLNVTKAWKNADGSTTAPEGGKVTFTLYADGTATNYTVELDGTADTAITGTGGYESSAWQATFVNLPKYNGDDEIEYTVTETGTWPGYTVSYGDGTTATYAVDGGTITNTQVPTELSVVKAWKNADGTTTPPEGGKVTFTLLADGTATNYTVELDGTADTAITVTGGYESAAWKATFVNLPKYNGDDEIEYTVTETGTWPGYTVSYGDGTTATYAVDGGTITNTQVPTELSVVKAWKNADGSTTPPEGGKVTFTLLADGTATNYTVELDGTADTAITGAGGYESAAWKATFVNLPKYNGDDEIEYTVQETGTWPGYTVSYGDGTTATYAVDGGTITNTQVPTGLSVVKAWKNADGSTTPPEGGKVTFTLYADGTATNYTVELDGTADTAITGTGGYESAAWKATFVNLPKYDGDDEIEYTVQETGTWPGYTVSYGDGTTATYAVDGGTITNTQEPTGLTVTKAWKNADGSTTAPEGGKVTFTLYADGTATNYTVELDGTADTAITGTGGYESAAWKATFVNLPKYNGDDEIEYTVTETGTWPGYTVSYGDGTTATYAVDGGTITNTQVPTGLSVVKAWKNADGSTTPPEGGKVTFTLYADGTATNYTVELDGTADTAITGAGGYESAAWKATFVNLPKYDGDDEIEYTVQETGTWPGYTVSYGDGTTATYAVDGGTITNTQVPTELSVTKAWKNADGSTTPPEGGKVTFTLLADGTATNYTVELDGTADTAITGAGGYESAAWKATFINLPKYDGNDEIEYTVTETGTWPGYTVSYGDGTTATYAVDGGTITNTQVPTELSVVKAWKNADGSTTAPEGGKVTFTLLADGTATNYTVELDGTPDTAITGTGGYESEAWKATFINLPKYKIENGKETEIEYTVTETGTWPGYTVSYGDNEETFAVDGGVITNEQITTEIGGTKTWNDDEFFVDGVPVNGYQRPESITIDLLADGTVIDSVTVTEDDEWEYEFTDLPKYKIVDGQAVEIEYTVAEETVPGYAAVVDGTDVENTPAKDENVAPTMMFLRKVDSLTWTEPINDDPDDPEEPAMRAESVDIPGLGGAEFTLTDPNGGEKVLTTDENGTLTIEFTTDGVYTLQETKAPDGYVNPGTLYTITVDKVFQRVELVDDENAPGGKVWRWFYQLEADVDADYDANTNTLTVKDPPELINIEGEKIWDDGNDIEGKRPKNITVELFADGEKIDEQVVTSANNWKFTFTDLPKMKDGKEIVYTIGELPVKEYTTTIEGFKITNKHEVKTGDEMNLGLWISIMIMAIAAMCILGVARLLKRR